MSDAFVSEQIGRITCHTFKNSSDEAVDEWVTSFQTFMEATAAERVSEIMVLPQVSCCLVGSAQSDRSVAL